MTNKRGRQAPLSMFALLAVLAIWGIWTLQTDAGETAPDDIETSLSEEAQEAAGGAAEPVGERELLKNLEATQEPDLGDPYVGIPRKKLTFAGRVLHAGQGVGSAEVHLVLGFGYRRPTDEAEILATVGTDALGRFELAYRSAAPSSASRFALVAQAEGYAPAEELVIYGARSFKNLELELFPKCEVKGVVVDAQSRVVENAEVQVGVAWSFAPSRLAKQEGLAYRNLPQTHVKTDEQGRFQLALPSNKDWFIVASAKAGRCQLFRSASKDRQVELRLQLVKPKAPPEVRIWGFVRDESGRMCPDVEVKLLEGSTWSKRTDDEAPEHADSAHRGGKGSGPGEFEFVVRVGSQCTLYAGGEGFAVKAHPLGRIIADMGPVILDLRRGLSIRGQLIGTDGKAMAGAVVKLTGDPILSMDRVPPVTLLSGFGKVRSITDAEGRFVFDALAPQEYWVQHREWNPPHGIAMAHVLAGSLDVVLRLGVVQGPAVEIRGRLTDALSGAPITGVRVHVSRLATYMNYGSGSYGAGRVATDAKGFFVFRGLEPGEYEVAHSARNYALAHTTARFYGAGKHVVQLHAYPSRSLSVVVSDLLGRPVHRARVYVIDFHGEELLIAMGGGGFGSPAFTNKKGQLNMHRLPASELTLRVEPTMWQESLDHAVVLVPAQPQEIQLKLEVIPGGKPRVLKMALRDNKGKPVELRQGCDVILEDLQGRRITGIPIRRDKKGQLAATVGARWIDKTVKGAVLRLSVPRTAFRARVAVAGYQDLVLQVPAGKQTISEQATLIPR